MKGSECIDNFRNMQECMQKYPELYPQEEDNGSSSQAESNTGSASTAPIEGSALSPVSDSAQTTSTSEADSQTAS